MIPSPFVVELQTYPKEEKEEEKEEEKKMVSIRVTSFILIVLTLLLMGDSTAQTHQDMKVKVVAENGKGHEVDIANMEKELYGTPAAAADEVEKCKSLNGGRKMMFKKVMKKGVENLKGEESKTSGASTRHSGKEILSVKCELRHRSSNPPHAVKVKINGFAAFSADYHVPKSHPPRNN